MKHLLTILSGLLVALLFARCADDDNLSGGIDGLPERGIVIRLSTGELDTRTQLTSTGDYHHVEEVWAVLYKWNGNESTDPNDPNNHGNYEFKSATLLELENGTPWNPYDASTQSRPNRDDYQTDEAYNTALDAYLENMQTNYGGEYGNGKVQGREFVLPESGAMQAGTYRVLCIGFDEASKTCYDLQNEGSLTLPTTLADAYAKLSSNKEFGGELFAGWQEFEFEPDNINIVEVELKRRVAGVLCYVNDIPTTITDGTSIYTINTIRLCLNTKANDAIHLCRLDDRTKDFGTTKGNAFKDEDKTILAEYTLSTEGQIGEIFTGKLQKIDNVQIKEGSVLLGAYLIPIKHVEGKATLSVELWGKDEDGNEKLAKTFNAVRSDDPDGQLTDDATQNTTSYDILPNYIYHIGDKDDDTDEPMSLLGQKITVKPKEWTGETIPVEFPSVPIFCTMELVNQYDVKYDQGYKFDCIGITDSEKDYGKLYSDKYDGESYTYQDYFPVRDRIRLNISPSVLGSKWKVSIDDESAGGGMLYFRDPLSSEENPSYTKFYGPQTEAEWKSSKTLDIVLTDYVNKADDDAGKTQRKAIIRLETYDTGGNTVTHTTELEVVQYNAIMIPYGNKTLGFSHYDWSSDRGEYPDGVQTTWNYFNSTPTAGIFGDGDREVRQTDGKKNYKNAKSHSTYNGTTVYNFYKQKDEAGTLKDGGCAIYKAGKKKVEIENGTKASANTVRWYLPAIEEIEAFFNKAKNVEGYYNIKKGTAKYWTSSTIAEALHNSRNIYLDSNGNVQKDDDGELYYGKNCSRKLLYYMRQVCVVGED